jgi:hypothetical protein
LAFALGLINWKQYCILGALLELRYGFLAWNEGFVGVFFGAAMVICDFLLMYVQSFYSIF